MCVLEITTGNNDKRKKRITNIVIDKEDAINTHKIITKSNI